MKQFPVSSRTRLNAAVGLIASSAIAMIAGCGGGGGSADSSEKPLAATQPSGQAASAAADSASAPASSAALDSAASAAVAGAASGAQTAPGASTLAVANKSVIGSPSGTSSSATVSTTPTSGTAVVVGSTGSTGIAGAAAPAAVVAATATPTAKIEAAVAAKADAVAVGDVVIYVETTGSDSNSGAVQASAAADGPVKTIVRAQTLARAKIAAMVAGTTTRAPVRVVIGPGEYPISTTLTFTPLDSGTATVPVSYEARQTGTVLITGGIDLGTKAAPAAATAIAYTAPTDAAAMAGGAQLFINGRRAILARQPNAGDAWFVQRAIPLATEAVGSEGSEAFAPSPANLSWIAGLTAADKKRAVVDVFQSWTDGRHRLSEQTTPAGSVRVTPKAKWPFLSLGGVSQRFFVENVLAAFDAAGEWIYDTGTVRYIRRADEAGAQLKATLPVLDRLVLVQGDATKSVQNLQFNGLSFAYTRYLTPDTGFTDNQAAYPISAAIEVNKARGVIFDSISVSRTAGWGIWLRDGVRDSQISRSNFTDLGAGAVKLGLASQLAADTGASGANQFINNTVSETGKVFPGAVAIWVGQSWDNLVQMNTIYNTSYTAISLGWSWGYADATSGRNIVKGNLIYNIGQRQMGDIAGVYTLGKSPGTVISNNIIRSIRGYTGYGAGAWGIYNDEGSSGLLMENNVILGTDNGAYHIHYGKDNILRGNVMAGGDIAEVRVTRLETAIDVSVQNNLIAPKVLQPFDQYAQAPSMGFSGNEVTPTLSGAGLVLTKCGTGCVLGSSSIQSTASPTDIRTTNTAWSTVIATTVGAWSGVAAGAPLTARLAAANLPAVADAPTALVAPAVDFVADIAGSAINARPINMVYLPKGDTVAIRVETQADAPNGKCLAFNDGATFVNRWEPYTYAQLNYTSGTTTVDFELKIDAATVLLTEWRDNATAYLTGPSMRITAAGVAVNGIVVVPVTVGSWNKFRVTSATGTPGSKWSLEVTRADGQKTTVNNLAPKDATWKNMQWLGFVSDTAATSRPCMASLKAANLTQ